MGRDLLGDLAATFLFGFTSIKMIGPLHADHPGQLGIPFGGVGFQDFQRLGVVQEHGRRVKLQILDELLDDMFVEVWGKNGRKNMIPSWIKELSSCTRKSPCCTIVLLAQEIKIWRGFCTVDTRVEVLVLAGAV